MVWSRQSSAKRNPNVQLKPKQYPLVTLYGVPGDGHKSPVKLAGGTGRTATCVRLASLALAATLLFGPAAGRVDAARRLPPSVFVEGDSLTVDSAPYLRSLAGSSAITIDAKIGRHMFEGVARLRKQRTLPGAIVIGLGSNDDFDAAGVARFQAHLNSLITLLGPKRCVVFIDMYQKRSPKLIKQKEPMLFTAMNSALASFVSLHSNTRLVRWSTMSYHGPEWFVYDSMHPTDVGYLARAQAVIASLRTCGPSSWLTGAALGDGSGGSIPGA
jgi:hypothetical protein